MNELATITEVEMKVHFRHQTLGRGVAVITMTGEAFADGSITQQYVARVIARMTQEEAERRGNDNSADAIIALP